MEQSEGRLESGGSAVLAAGLISFVEEPIKYSKGQFMVSVFARPQWYLRLKFRRPSKDPVRMSQNLSLCGLSAN